MPQTIKDILSSDSNIDRNIEKVIDYERNSTEALKEEVSEYVVTDALNTAFKNLLERMQYGMDGQGASDIGIWVSGFYGSGKSSFTKYLGCAFEKTDIDGKPFHQLLASRFADSETRALLNATINRSSAAVIKLDLATQQMGTDVQEISDILYRSIRKQFGYAYRDDDVFDFEQMVKRDNRWEELQQTAQDIGKRKWADIQNQPFLIKSIFPKIAKAMYPELDSTSSTAKKTDSNMDFTDIRLQDMVDLVRHETGKENILFIIDEVGQYVGSRPNCILDLDGTARILKRIGDGHVWLLATAQQTLTEEGAAALNSKELFKLKDRFPIAVTLPATDIKEICYKRLLGKSGEGNNWLAQAFKDHNQTLRAYTTLQDARLYQDGTLTENDLLLFYPFLPWHFDLVINLLGVLARSTGGIGLRSAIKVVQDILVGRYTEERFYNQPAGTLVTLADIYDELKEDIDKADPALATIMTRLIGDKGLYREDSLSTNVAKALAVLFILADPGCPALPKNIAALLQPTIDSESLESKVTEILADMAARQDVPVSLAADGKTYTFLSEKLGRIERERATVNVMRRDITRTLSEGLREVLPKVSVKVSDALSRSIEIVDQNEQAIVPANDGIRLYLRWIDPTDQEQKLVEEDIFIREKGLDKAASLVCTYTEKLEELLRDICARQEIQRKYQHDADKDISQYCNTQIGVITAKKAELVKLLQSTISDSIMLHEGTRDAISQLGGTLQAAMSNIFTGMAKTLYNKNEEAPVRVETNTAERFLKAKDKSSLTSRQSPLPLIAEIGGKAQFNKNCPAVKSIMEQLSSGGTTGKALIDRFNEAPYGWAKDTTLYVLAGMFWGEELELTINGKSHKIENDAVYTAFKNTANFGKVGVQSRTSKADPIQIMDTVDFLTPLCGTVGFTEKEVCQAAANLAITIRTRLGEIVTASDNLGLHRSDWLNNLQDTFFEIANLGGSNIISLVCSSVSQFKGQMTWYQQVAKAEAGGIFDAIRDYNTATGKLRIILGEELDETHRVQAETLNTTNMTLVQMLDSPGWIDGKLDFQNFAYNVDALEKSVLQYKADWLRTEREKAIRVALLTPGWEQLNSEQQTTLLSKLPAIPSINSISQANQFFSNIQTNLSNIVKAVEQALVVPPVKVNIKKKLKTIADIDALMAKLQAAKAQLTTDGKTIINLEWED